MNMAIRRTLFSARTLALIAVYSICATSVSAAQLKAKTVKAWDKYVQLTEDRISRELKSEASFLAADFLNSKSARSCKALVRKGEICVLDMRAEGERADFKVPEGRIHHWLGTTLIPEAKLAEVIPWIQNYDRHQEYYDDVEESRLISREDNFFQIFLRLKRKKVITVHYNTNHDVNYYPQDPERLYSSSIATRIREITDPGTPDEKEKPEGKDNGFLWRLNSYWRYKETPEGVVVECESLSLSRSVPALLFMIEGIVDSTAREALQYTLGNLRDGFLGSPK